MVQARPVDTLDACHLDIGGGRRTGEERRRQRRGKLQPGHRFRHRFDHRARMHQAKVVIRKQGGGAAALSRSILQHNGAGLGDRGRRAGQHAVTPVQRSDNARRIFNKGHRIARVREPVRVDAGGHSHAPLAAFCQDACDQCAGLRGGAAVDARVIVVQAVFE
jgi:hypothetical protein